MPVPVAASAGRPQFARQGTHDVELAWFDPDAADLIPSIT